MTAVESLRRVLKTSGLHKVTWVAYDGEQAVQACAAETPDLVLMDLIMPKMDGVKATRKIMQATPCSILVVTASVSGNSSKVFEAMGAGALDAVATPVLGKNFNANGGDALLEKINRIGKLIGIKDTRKHQIGLSKFIPINNPQEKCLVAIGSSTGGPQALARVLAPLPKDFPAAVVVIQHMDAKFTKGLVNWIDSQIDLPVRLAKDGDIPDKGTVLFACTDDHLVMADTKFTMRYTQEPRENYYHPSVDVFFTSVARWWSGSVIGILLTGMGRDGAEGMLALQQKGWHTIAQDQATSVVYGMPRAAAELNAAKEILSIDCIGPACIDLLAPKRGIYHG